MFTAVFSLPCLRPKAVNVEMSPLGQLGFQWWSDNDVDNFDV